MIVKYLFASETQPQRLLFPPHDASAAETVTLIKGAYLIRDTYAEWLGQGHLGSCATNLLNQRPSQTHCPYDVAMNSLAREISEMTAIDGDVEACREAVQTLRQLFALSAISSHTANVKGLCIAWLARLPTAFFDDLKARKSGALVVLAHFCIILEDINNDSVWYMKGWSRSLFDECVKNINRRWTPAIEWPLAVFRN